MCLIVLAWRQHPTFPLLLAANRDEFHRRPAAPAAFWTDVPTVVAGRDLEAGGTWLGVSRSGRFAAITNIRDPGSSGRTAPRSRGELTVDFLSGARSPQAYLRAVAARRGEYQGFNLLLADGDSLWYLHGGAASASAPRPLKPGIYGLSNAALDVPWPKVRLAREQLRRALETGAPQAPDHVALRDAVASRELASAAELQGQGLSGEMARALSGQFIVGPEYGTRCCTTLRWEQSGAMEFHEQRFAANGRIDGEDRFRLDGQRSR